MNKGKMKTINLNAESEYDIVLISHYSEANNCFLFWCFLLILEKWCLLNAKREQVRWKRKTCRNHCFKRVVRLLIMLITLRVAYFNHFSIFFPPPQRNVK